MHAELQGPSGSGILRLALDTGATKTLVSTGMLVAVGYDPALAPERLQITTGSGVEFVPRIPVGKVSALGLERRNLPVVPRFLANQRNALRDECRDHAKNQQKTANSNKAEFAVIADFPTINWW